MKIKRAVMLAVLAVAVAALAVPLVGLRARAAGPMKGSPAAKAATLTASSVGAAAAATSVGTQDGVQLANGQHSVMAGTPVDLGDLSPEVREAFGMGRMTRKEVERANQKMKAHLLRGANRSGGFSPQSGEPEILNATSALSASLLTTVGGRPARVLETPNGPIALFRTSDDRVFALRDRCPHRGGPLSQGIVHGACVTCPLHDWVIDLATGTARAPDEGGVDRFAVRVERGRVLVELAVAGLADAALPLAQSA